MYVPSPEQYSANDGLEAKIKRSANRLKQIIFDPFFIASLPKWSCEAFISLTILYLHNKLKAFFMHTFFAIQNSIKL